MIKYSSISISMFTVLAIGCGGVTSSPSDSVSPVVPASSTNDPAATNSSEDRSSKVHFQPEAPFRVLSITRNLNAHSSSNDTLECVGWTLTQEQCSKVLAGSSPISGPEWHHSFDVLPCQVEGELSQGGSLFRFSINAGSWFSVSCGDTSLLFGDMDMRLKELFVSPVWVEEE